MAEVSMKAIKSRIKSVESTLQITHAMELVSTSKLQKAKTRALSTKSIHTVLSDTLYALSHDRQAYYSELFGNHESGKKCFIVISGDRGLAGGYNSNLFRFVSDEIENNNSAVLPIGKKSLEHYKTGGKEIISSLYGLSSNVKISDCFNIGKLLYDAYTADRYSSITIVYTEFTSILTQIPRAEQIFPLVKKEDTEFSTELAIYEPSLDEIIKNVAIQYISTMLYCAVSEAVAAEHAARRNSMNNANKNGEKMLDDMRLQYNRARQSVITQEITEIVAGSNS